MNIDLQKWFNEEPTTETNAAPIKNDNAALKNEAIRLKDEKMSNREIAKKLNVNEGSIRRWFKSEEIQPEQNAAPAALTKNGNAAPAALTKNGNAAPAALTKNGNAAPAALTKNGNAAPESEISLNDWFKSEEIQPEQNAAHMDDIELSESDMKIWNHIKTLGCGFTKKDVEIWKLW